MNRNVVDYPRIGWRLGAYTQQKTSH